MKIKPTLFPEVLLIEPTVYSDNRGYFLESHHQNKYLDAGIAQTFVQDNISFSKKNVLRGLHYQLEHAQDKLVYVIRGAVLDVVVDIRKGSPNFGKWISRILSDENHLQIYIPRGFAHGFCVLSESADFVYKCSDFYYPSSEFGIAWNDPVLNINWEIEQPILSDKDKCNKNFSEIHEELLPTY